MKVPGNNIYLPLLIAAISGVSNGVAAQESPAPATDQNNAIENVVIVGQATNTLITTEDLETYQANDLADVFRLVPSISVGGSVGIAQKIFVRGLEDSLINVTVDGAPQTSTLFHHIGRVTIDPSLLKEVDVQAGAGEATSGAGAIGGSIRFKTKDASDLLAEDERVGGNIKANHFTNDGQQYSASLYGRLTDSWGLVAYYSDIERDNMEDGNGNEIFGSAADQALGFVKLSGDISNNQFFSLSYENRDEEGEFSARPNWFVAEDDTPYPSEAKRETLVANYDFQLNNFLNLEATTYNTESSYSGGRFDWLANIATFGFDIRNTSFVSNHKFTYGVEYRDDEVSSGPNVPQPNESYLEEGQVFGAYAQAHSQVSDYLLLSYGLRYDQYDFEQKDLAAGVDEESAMFDDSKININLGLLYNLTDTLDFGLGYAEASRGKEIGDGFTLDSFLYDGSSEPIVDSDLKAETVSNIETSLEYHTENTRAKFAIFSSEIDDVILNHSAATYENIGTVETNGIEIEFAYRWNDFDLFLGFASVDSELDPASGLYAIDYSSIDLNNYELNGLGNSIGDTLNLGLNYTPTSQLTLGFSVSHVEELNIETLHQDLDASYVTELYTLNKPSYTTVDVFAEWIANDHLTFNLSVINLFDELYRDHASVGDYTDVPDYEIVAGPLEAGRDLRLTANFNF